MPFRASNAPDAPPPSGGYSQAVAFEGQARLAWRNVERQLAAAGMDLAGIVKHTTYLARREGREANGRVRREILGDLEPALTVVIAGIFDESWLLEIEAIAAA
jgi:enamine deaminase RidA (YjgF/YER057c/UK114 family)